MSLYSVRIGITNKAHEDPHWPLPVIAMFSNSNGWVLGDVSMNGIVISTHSVSNVSLQGQRVIRLTLAFVRTCLRCY
jgi:hypothetical protein